MMTLAVLVSSTAALARMLIAPTKGDVYHWSLYPRQLSLDRSCKCKSDTSLYKHAAER
jgi:hypothetical protein